METLIPMHLLRHKNRFSDCFRPASNGVDCRVSLRGCVELPRPLGPRQPTRVGALTAAMVTTAEKLAGGPHTVADVFREVRSVVTK